MGWLTGRRALSDARPWPQPSQVLLCCFMGHHWQQQATVSQLESLSSLSSLSSGGGQDISRSTVWLSVTVDGDVFEEAEKPALQPLTDWHIVVTAPLVLENTLPIAGSYIVWEHPEVCAVTPA